MPCLPAFAALFFPVCVSVAALLLLAPVHALNAQEETAAETEAEELYETAFRALANGQYGTAYGHLNDITTGYPTTRYAPFAAERKRRLEELGLHRSGSGPGDQGGRTGALVYGTLYSTWLGVGTSIVVGADSDQALAAGMMAGAPAGLVAAHLLTRDRALSPGQGALVRLGGLWGTWQGFGWTVAAGDEPSERRLTAFSMAGGLAGIAGSSALTRVADVSPGDASLLDYAGLWGTWFGFCLSVMAEVEDDGVLKSSLTGGNLGLAGMAMLLPRIEMSREQARLVNLGGVAGTFVASGIVGLIALQGSFDNATVPMGIITAGGIAGLWSGFAAAEGDLPPGTSGRKGSLEAVPLSGPVLAPWVPATAVMGLAGGHPAPRTAAVRGVQLRIRF